jgi:diguanylate cyclase (GGDEF)-like protein
LGHAAGDDVLVAVGEKIKSVIRSKDFAARIGGDEFVVLLSNCEMGVARKVAGAMAAAVAEIPVLLNGRSHKMGASIGVVPLSAEENPDVSLARADAACYAAKKRGRGQIVVAG